MGYDSIEASRDRIKHIESLLRVIANIVEELKQDLEGRAAEMEITNGRSTETSEA